MHLESMGQGQISLDCRKYSQKKTVLGEIQKSYLSPLQLPERQERPKEDGSGKRKRKDNSTWRMREQRYISFVIVLPRAKLYFLALGEGRLEDTRKYIEELHLKEISKKEEYGEL
jgi:hypothetical protein